MTTVLRHSDRHEHKTSLRLNAFNVKSLPARDGKRTTYRDDLQRGFELRVSPSGVRTFAIVYWRRGRKRRYTLGQYPLLSLALAREEARNLLARVALGEDPQNVRTATHQAQLVVQDACIADLKLKPSTRREWERLAKVEIRGADIGQQPAATLSRRAIRGWAEAIKTRSHYTANRAWELLRRTYSWGVEHEQIPATPFLPRESKPGTEEESDRVLSAAEVGALWRALEGMEGQYADATRLLLLTGVRREMVVGARILELEGLDGKDPRWTVPAERSKGGRPHVVPLSPAAVDVLRHVLERVDDYLFPPARAAKVRPNAMWWSSRFVRELRELVEAEYRAAAKMPARRRKDPPAVPDWTIHDLRRAVGTHLTEDLGVDPAVVSLILGHAAAGPRVSTRYNRAERLPERRVALEAWASWVAAQAEQGRSENASQGRVGPEGAPVRALARKPLKGVENGTEATRQ